MEEYIIKLKKTEGKGGWRAAVLTSQHGAKIRDAFAKTPKEALSALADKLHERI